MKAFFVRAPFFLLLFASSVPMASSAAVAAADPKVAGPWTELRKAPLFTSELLPLAKMWGPAIPVGTAFQVEKVYGRWVFGKPTPSPHMHRSLHAPPGWVFSRMLLIPGDADTLTASVVKWMRSFYFHSLAARQKLEPKKPVVYSSVDLLASLTLSQKTLNAFSLPEVGAAPAGSSLSLIPEALAAEGEEEPAPMGLTGTDLSFLDSEIKVIQERKKKESIFRETRKLKLPPPPPISSSVRQGILGQFMLDRYLELPPLTLEEVDGYIYMRATAMRALRGCPKNIQSHWKNRHWNFFRIFRLKSRPEQRHPWFEIALPGGFFALSGRAIQTANNEAELAFLLVRQLVRELRVPRKPIQLTSKGWPQSLPAKAEEIWDLVLKAQSTKDSDTFDVADEIAVDMQAVQCLANAGYRPAAAIGYLRKLAANREQPWAEWFTKHAIGLDYRIERVIALIQDDLAKQKYPEGKDSQSKRFASASKQWNILP